MEGFEMAKIGYAKLGIKPEVQTNTLTWNDEIIEVKNYLPIKEKLALVISVIENAADENRFLSPLKLEVFFTLEVITSYTNITFTDKQKEDPGKLYDSFITTGLYNNIRELISEKELHVVYHAIWNTAHEIYKYDNSIFGILDTIANDYKDVQLNAEQLQSNLANPNNLQLLRDVLTKLG